MGSSVEDSDEDSDCAKTVDQNSRTCPPHLHLDPERKESQIDLEDLITATFGLHAIGPADLVCIQLDR